MFYKLFILSFLLFLNYPDCQGYFSLNAAQEKTKKDKNDVGLEKKLHSDQWELDFWASLRVIPVKFISKTKDNTLIAEFVSDLAIRQINFRISPEKPHAFSKTSGGWEEELDDKRFLKEMKNEFWLVIYFAGGENIIHEAHQFKTWKSIDVSFPPDDQQITKSNKTLAYWSRLRIKLLYFYYIEGDEANWILFSTSDNRPVESNEVLELKNNFRIRRRGLPSKDNAALQVSETGTFLIDEKTTFTTVEVKTSKLPSIPFMGSGIKTKPQTVSKDYFVKNSNKSLWICFYDNQSKKIIRVNERKLINIELAK